MRIKLLFIISAIFASSAMAQMPTDTVFNPTVVFTGIPRTYELAGISVEGASNYDDYIIIGYSGL